MGTDRVWLAEHAERVSRGFEADAIKMMQAMLREPVRYANVVIDADEDEVDQIEFSRRVKATVSPLEHAFLTSLGEAMGATPGEDLIQLQRWARTRVVYVIDPDTATAVQNTDWGSTVIPAEVLARLPHPNPMVILPEPVRIPSSDGTVEKYEAFMVLGMREPRKRCSSSHPDAIALVMHFLGRVVDPVTDRPVLFHGEGLGGRTITTPQLLGMRTLTPLVDMTMSERQEFAARDILNLGERVQVGFANEEEAVQVTRDLTALALSILTYLATDDVDSQQAVIKQRQERKKHRGGRVSSSFSTTSRDTTVVEVGYRIGSALRNAHKAAGPPHSTGEGSGKRTVSAHVRKAHIHTFRRGKGRKETFIKWLPPLAVAWKPGTQLPTQIHFPD